MNNSTAGDYQYYYSVDNITNPWVTSTTTTTTNQTWTLEEQEAWGNRYFICSYCREKIKDGVAVDGYVYCSKRHAFLNKLKESSEESILK